MENDSLTDPLHLGAKLSGHLPMFPMNKSGLRSFYKEVTGFGARKVRLRCLLAVVTGVTAKPPKTELLICDLESNNTAWPAWLSD